MTEPLTLTVVTAALLAMARALEEPSMWRYGVFAAWATAAAAVRLQALVLLPAFLLAALIDAGAARDRARLRPLVLLGAVAVAMTVVVGVVIVLLGGELSSRRVLGAYTPIGEGAPVESGARRDRLARASTSHCSASGSRCWRRRRSLLACSRVTIATPRCARSSP